MIIKEITHNIITGEKTTTEREETAKEKAEREAMLAQFAVEKDEVEAKAAQRQALLTRLGITEEEARILLGGN
jgi:hypothetical protein